MRVMPCSGLILNVRRVDRDPTRLLFRSRVNLRVTLRFASKFLRQYHRDRRRQCGLAMIHMPNRPNVHVRLRPLKFTLCHDGSPFLKHFFLSRFLIDAYGAHGQD